MYSFPYDISLLALRIHTLQVDNSSEEVTPVHSIGDLVSVRENTKERGNAAIPMLGCVVAIAKRGSRASYTIKDSITELKKEKSTKC